jgi:HEAT repeat protein
MLKKLISPFLILFITIAAAAQNNDLPPEPSEELPQGSAPEIPEVPQNPEAPQIPAGPETSALSSADEQRLQIIRYGTDTEIANLIRVLRGEQAGEGESPLDRELLEVAGKTKNRAILSGVFSYFGDREKTGLESRALEAIEDRDYEAAETVNAAIDYLGKLRAPGVKEALTGILEGEESRFLSGAIRTLGRTAEKDGPEETARYLIDYYTNREPGDENRRILITAVGDTKSGEAVPFLVSIAENEDERAPLRMAALEGLSKIADTSGLDAIIGAASSKDPNIRSTAIGALGPFEGDNADAAIIEAFRDSYYRTRIAAAKAAGERRLARAVPFLRFRSENDDVPAVREEAIKAMGLIGGNEAEKVLEALFKERKNSDRVRINAGEMLLTHGKEDHVRDVIAELEEAKAKNQTALYNGFLRILGNAKSDSLEDLARRFFAAGGVVEKSYALDICSNNEFRGLVGEIRNLTDPKNGSLSRKSLALLEKWGLPVNAPEESTPEESTPDPSSGPGDLSGGDAATDLPEPANPVGTEPREPISNEAAGSAQ